MKDKGKLILMILLLVAGLVVVLEPWKLFSKSAAKPTPAPAQQQTTVTEAGNAGSDTTTDQQATAQDGAQETAVVSDNTAAGAEATPTIPPHESANLYDIGSEDFMN